MNEDLQLIIAIILLPEAAYRITRFVTTDKITEPIFDPLRLWLETRWIRKHAGDDENLAYLYGKSEKWNSKLAFMLSCPWCLGFWVSGAGSLLVSTVYGLDYLVFALLWLATSTIVGLIGRIDSE
jgi:thiosulfate reductase cytochrome b subunit